MDIQTELDIKAGSWDYWYWDNTLVENHHQGFRDFVKSCKHERMLNKADQISNEVTSLIAVDDKGKVDQHLLKIKHDEAKFLRQTLGKLDFSTRVENDMTSNGNTLQPLLVEFINAKPKDNTNT
tara:strand:+ start:139 stop:510 length:372 start_codon:yes stop_codon:yes gene_type:complete